MTKVSTIFILMILFLCSCAGKETKVDSVKSEGFINDDEFRIIVRGEPDKNAQGLLSSRESALINSYQNARDFVITGLKNEMIKTFPAKKTQIEYNIEITNYLDATYLKAKPIAEYYESSGSHCIIIKISEKNIKNAITAQINNILQAGNQ
ncbi:MAG TPA: hypothetical protein PLH15_07565 [Spirochaetota bacterium]|nr:hypothetical protein [Spirochaetota bacterium]